MRDSVLLKKKIKLMEEWGTPKIGDLVEVLYISSLLPEKPAGSFLLDSTVTSSGDDVEPKKGYYYMVVNTGIVLDACIDHKSTDVGVYRLLTTLSNGTLTEEWVDVHNSNAYMLRVIQPNNQ